MNFALNRKSMVKFGKYSLSILSIFLFGYFLVNYVIPALAVLTPGAPPGRPSVTLNISTTNANQTDEFFTCGNVVWLRANVSSTTPANQTLIATANFSVIGGSHVRQGVNVSGIENTSSAGAGWKIFEFNATVSCRNETGAGVSNITITNFQMANVSINASISGDTVVTSTDIGWAGPVLVNMSTMPGCPPAGENIQLPPAIPLLNGQMVTINGTCIQTCTVDDRAQFNSTHYNLCGPNFGGDSTNFTQVAYNGNFSSIPLVIDIPGKAKINFTQGVNMSDRDKAGAVMQFAMKNIMSGGRIGVNDSEWNGLGGKPDMRLSARLTIYNASGRLGITAPHIPWLSYRSTYGGGSFSSCPPSVCTASEWDGENFTFTVTSFSEYDVGSGLSVVLSTPANNANITNNSFVSGAPFRNVNFTFTPTWNASVTVRNVTLYGNFTGSWAKNITNSTPLVNATVNGINITLPADGAYIWNVYIYDNTTGLADQNTNNFTVRIDTGAPSLTNPVPADNSYRKGTSSELFQVNVNEKYLNTTINATVFYKKSTSSTWSTATTQCWNTTIYYTNTSDWMCNTTVDLSPTAPEGFVEGNTVQFFFNATDGARNVGYQGTQVSPFSLIIDKTEPSYFDVGTNDTDNVTGKPYSINLSTRWTDNYNLNYSWLQTNETGVWENKTYKYNFSLSGTSGWTNYTWSNSSVAAGTVVMWRIFVNDSANNQNTTTNGTVFTIDGTPPQWSANTTVISSGTQYAAGQTYIFNVTVTDATVVDTVILKFNAANTTAIRITAGSNNFSASVSDLKANTTGYEFSWIVNDTSGNVNTTAVWSYVIAKNTSQITRLWLNDTAGDRTYNRSWSLTGANVVVANFTASSNINSTTGVPYVGINTTIYANFTGSIGNITANWTLDGIPPANVPGNNTPYATNNTNTLWLSLGNYSIIANSTANENYTASSSVSYVLVITDQIVPTLTLYDYTNGTVVKNGSTITLNTLLSDNDRFASPFTCTVRVGTSIIGAIANSSATWCNGTVTVNVTTSGNYTLNISAPDISNNVGYNLSYVIDLDNVAPTITNTTPLNNTYIGGGSTELFQVYVTEQHLNFTANNISLYYGPIIGTYSARTLQCWNTVSSNNSLWICNTTVNLAGYGDGDIVYYLFNGTDKAGSANTNGTHSQPLRATIDRGSPQYSNVGTNVSGNVIGKYIGIRLNTYWTDSQALSYAILETNESGTATNKTVYSSPMALTGTATWSNFSWSNSSVAAGAVVSWRIFANDTYGNQNVTTASTFTIDGTAPQVLYNDTNNTAATANGTTITKGTVINISAQWTDNLNLDKYWLVSNYSSITDTSPYTFTTGNWTNYSISTASFTNGVTFTINITANDTSGNQNNTVAKWQWTMDGTASQYGNITTSQTSGLNYTAGATYIFNVSYTDNINVSTVLLEWMGATGAANYTATRLVGGTAVGGNFSYTFTDLAANITGYSYRWFATDTSGNQNVTSTQTFIVATGASNITFYLNNTESSLTVRYPQAINASAVINISAAGQNTFNLYENGTTKGTQSGQKIDYVVVLGARGYNFTAYYASNNNYTAYNTSTLANFYTTVQQGVSNITLLINNANANSSIQKGITANFTAVVNTTYNVIINMSHNLTSGAGWANLSNTTSQVTNLTSTSALTTGIYNVTAFFSGDANFTSDTETLYLTLTADTTAPTITVHDYVNGSLTGTIRKSGRTIMLNISVSDAGSGLVGTYCNVTINGLGTENITRTSGWCNGTVTIPTTGIGADGNKTINITISDEQNNLGFNESYVVTVDNTPPTFTITSPTNGTYIKLSAAGRIWINGTVTDNIALGTNNTALGTNNSTFSIYQLAPNGTNFNVSNGSIVNDGYVILTLNYTDNATNIGNATVYFYEDNTAPTSVNGLSNATFGKYQPNSSQTIQVRVTDNLMTNGSLTMYYWTRINGTVLNMQISGTVGASTVYTATIDTSGLTDNDWVRYYITGIDNATNSITGGGSSSSPLANITIDIYCGSSGSTLAYCSHNYNSGFKNGPATGTVGSWYSLTIPTGTMLSGYSSLSNNYNVSNVFSSVSGSYSYVYYKNITSSGTIQWLTYDPNIAWDLNTLRFANQTNTEYWFNVTAAGAILRIS